MLTSTEHCIPSIWTPTTVRLLSSRRQGWPRYLVLASISSNNSAPHDPAYDSDSTSAVPVLSDSWTPHNFDSGTLLQSGLDHHICNIRRYRDCQKQRNHLVYVSLVGILFHQFFAAAAATTRSAFLRMGRGLGPIADWSILHSFGMFLAKAD